MALDAGQTLSGTLNIVGSDGASHNITLGTQNSTDNLVNLASTINAAGYGVTASVNQAGTQLTFTTADSGVSVSGTNIEENTASTSSNATIVGSGLGSLSVGGANDTLTGTLNVTSGADGSSHTITLGTQGSTDTLANLAASFSGSGANAGLGITATLSNNNTTINFAKSSGDADTPSITASNVMDVAAPAVGVGSTLGSLSVANAGDSLGSGTLNITSGITGTSATPLTLGEQGTTDTLANLAATINGGNYGITATLDKTGTDLTFTQTSGSKAASVSGTNIVDNTFTTVQNPISISQAFTMGSITLNGASDTITGGTLDITSAAGKSSTLALSGTTLAAIESGFNTSTGAQYGLGITASLSADGKTLSFTGSGSAAISEVDTIASNAPVDTTAASVPTTQIISGTGSTLGTLTVMNANEGLASGDSLTIVQGSDGQTKTLALGVVAGATTSTDTLAHLAATINNDASYGITATLSSDGTSLSFAATGGVANTHTASITSSTINEQPDISQGAILGSLTAGTSGTETYAFTGSFIVNGNTANPLSFNGASLSQIADTINGGNYGITATLNNTALGTAPVGTVLTFTNNGTGSGTPTITNNGAIQDHAQTTNTDATVSAPSGGNLAILTANGAGSLLTGSLTLTEGVDNAATQQTFSFSGQSLTQIANQFTGTGQYAGMGITATVTGGNTVVFTQNALDTGTAAVSGSNIKDVTDNGTTGVTVAAGTILDTITVANANDLVQGKFSYTPGAGGVYSQTQYNTATDNVNGVTLKQIAADFDNGYEGTAALTNLSTKGITANLSADGTTLTFTQTVGDASTAAVNTYNTTPLVDNIAQSTATQTYNTAGNGNMVNTLTVGATTDKLTGTLNIQEGADGNNTQSTYNLTGKTLADVAADFTTGAEKNLGIVATLDSAGTGLTFTQAASNLGTANVTNATSIIDTQVPGSQAPISLSTDINLGTMTVGTASDFLTGTLSGKEGDGTTSFNAGSGINLSGYTLQSLAAAFNTGAYDGYGISASLNATDTSLSFTAKGSDTGTPSVSTTSYSDIATGVIPVNITNSPVQGGTIGSLTVNNLADGLTGTLNVTDNTGGTHAITLGTVSGSAGASTDNITDLAAYFNSGTGSTYGIKAVVNGDTLTLSDNSTGASSSNVASVQSSSVTDGAGSSVVANPAASATIGSLTVDQLGDTLGGSIAFISNVGVAAVTANPGADNASITAATVTTGIGGSLALTGSIDYSGLGGASTLNNAVLGAITVAQASDTLAGADSFNINGGGATLVSAMGGTGTIADIKAYYTSGAGSTDGVTAAITTNANGSSTLTLTNTSGATMGSGAVLAGTDKVTDTLALGTRGTTDNLADLKTTLQGSVYNAMGYTPTGTTTLDIGGLAGEVGTFSSAYTYANNSITLGAGINNITELAAALNTGGADDTYGVNAAVTPNGDGTSTITFTDNHANAANGGVSTVAALPQATDTVADVLPTTTNSVTVQAANETLSGTLSVSTGTGTTVQHTLTNQTIAQIAANFNDSTGATANWSSEGVTATINNNTLTFSQTSNEAADRVNVVSTGLTDTIPVTAVNVGVANGTMLDTMSVNNSTDTLGGTLNITSGIDGQVHQLALGTTGANATDTLAHLAATITAGGYGVTATLNQAGTQMTLTQNSGDGFNAGIGTTSVTDTGAMSLAPSNSLGTLTAKTATDTMTGTLSGVGADGKTAYQINFTGDTLSEVLQAVNGDQAAGITASLNKAGTGLSFSATQGDNGTPTIGNYGNITDTTVSTQTAVSITSTPTSGVANSSTLGSLSISSLDTLSGSMTIGGQTLNIGSSDNTAATLASTIDKGNYGVQAAYNANSGQLTFTSPNSAMGISTSSLNETAPGATTGTAVGSLTGAYTSSGYYSRGITGTVTDTSTQGGTQTVGITANANGSGGIATMSYKDGAGQSLSATDLSNQSDAQTALTDLNMAITDVAAQDGYIGAQINTLNSVSSVLSTQQQNVVSAQNAVQATDYASATSNMSKYEILSQTGIAALAQANSLSQEVTKLLQ
jgi:flagellin